MLKQVAVTRNGAKVTGRINVLRWGLKLNTSSAMQLLMAFDFVLCSLFSGDYLT